MGEREFRTKLYYQRWGIVPHGKALRCMHMRGADGAFLPTLFSLLTLSDPNSPDPATLCKTR